MIQLLSIDHHSAGETLDTSGTFHSQVLISVLSMFLKAMLLVSLLEE